MSSTEESVDSGSSHDGVDYKHETETASETHGDFIELEPQSNEEGPDERIEWDSEMYEDDREDQELLSELRELYKGLGVNSSLVLNMSSESLNSTGNDDPERLRGKVEQLQRNVCEWKDSYDQLMNEFRKLRLEKVVEKEELIKEVKVLSSNAKDLQQTVRRLESELAEHRNLLMTADSNSQYLLNEVNSLRKERGMREVELNGVTNQVNALNRDSKLARLTEEDLGHVINLIDRGVNEGILKLSELSLGSQAPPFPCHDLPLGPCGCGPLLERYKEDLELTRQELEERVGQLDLVRGERDSIQEEHREVMDELSSGRSMLNKTIHERSYLEEELSKKGERLASLELEVRSLEDHLDVSRHKERSLDDSLNSTSQSLKHVQELTQQHLDLKDQVLNQLKLELAGLEEGKKKLKDNLKESQVNVDRLERAYRQAQEESEQLAEDLEEQQREKGRQMEITSGEKEKLQRELSGMVVELECQVKLAEQYKANLGTVQHLHCKCQEEAGRVRALLLSKETELSRMLTTLQVTAGQISSLRRRGGGGSSPRTPRTVSQELSECEAAVEEVERELCAHHQHWEALKETTTRDAATISQLTASKDQLEAEMKERENNVKYLESLLQEVGVNHGRLQEAVEDYEEYIDHLKEEVTNTQLKYQNALEENCGLKENLDSMDSLQDQQRLLTVELEKKNEGLANLRENQKEMDELFQECLKRAEEAEAAKSLLEEAYARVRDELEERERTVEALEKRANEERSRGEEEVCVLKKQLEDEENLRAQEIAKCATAVSELKVEFETKTRSLEDALEDEHAQYLEVKRLLVEREKAIQRLKEETTFLDRQHEYTKQEVEHSQDLVETLQEDLASSKGRCHGLQRTVSEYESKLDDMAEQVHVHQHTKRILQDQVVVVASEADALQDELEASRSSHSFILDEDKEHFHALQEELAICQSKLTQHNQENSRLNLTCVKQDTEIAKLLLRVADLERQKDFDISSYDKTVQSLKSQVFILENTQHSRQEEKAEDAGALSEQLTVANGELEVANDRLVQLERSKAVLELVGTERLEEIRALTRELEEIRIRGELVGELRERVQHLEEELWKKQEEIDNARDKIMNAEISHEEIHAKLKQFEQCLTEAAEKERLEEELQALVDDQEKDLSQLREQCFRYEENILLLESETRANLQKEYHWKSELSLMSTKLELSQQQTFQLEGDLGSKEREMEILEAKLRQSARLQDLAREEVSSSCRFKENLQHQLGEKRERILELERQLGVQLGEIATLRGRLEASDETRLYNQKHVMDLEGDNDCLRQDKSEMELELKTMEQKMEDKLEQSRVLQEDCKSLTEKVSTLSEGESRSSNETLILKIRALDSQLASIKASHGDLDLRNELLTQTNSELKSQLNALSMPSEGRENLASGSGNSLNRAGGGPPSSLSLSVNVDITNIPPTSSTTTLTTGTSAVGMATATIPIRFDSRYLKTMEGGLSTTSLEDAGHYGDSETESEAALDKDYWIRRAGELSLQLQQSSEYWAQKVRELSIDLEKQRHTPRHVD